MAFAKINLAANSLSAWITLFVSAWAAFSWLAKEMTRLGSLNWADAIMLGLLAACLAILALASILTAWRFFRPLSSGTDGGEAVAPDPSSDIFNKIENRFAAVEQALEVKPDYFRLMDVRMNKIEGMHKAIIDDYQNMRGGQASITDKIEGLRSDFATVKSDIVKISEARATDYEKIRGSFYALQARERLDDFAKEIEQDADLLYRRLSDGETYDADDWVAWETVQASWWGKINAWLETAKWYAPDVVKRVIEFPDAAYGGEWPVGSHQFPDPEAVRRFKRHRIIHRRWEGIREEVRNGIDSVAFIGLTDRDVRRGQSPE